MKRTQREIDEQVGRAVDSIEQFNGSRYPGMGYEEGVLAAIDWLTGECDSEPMEED